MPLPPEQHQHLAALCAELASDPAASNPEIDSQLRGWSVYPQPDGSHCISFESNRVDEHAAAPLATATITSQPDGRIVLRMSLSNDARASATCREAARAAAQPIASVPGIQLDDDLGVCVQLPPGTEATQLAEAVCALELAAVTCAREVRATAHDEELARAYLASHTTRARAPDADAA